MRPKINVEECKGCGLCVVYCPKNILEMTAFDKTNRRGYSFPIVKKENECTGCGACYRVCPEGRMEIC